jgi:hypothetical protein
MRTNFIVVDGAAALGADECVVGGVDDKTVSVECRIGVSIWVMNV